MKMTEKAIHAAVVAHWRVFGIPGSLVATIPNMKAFGQVGLRRGLPDLIVMSPTLGCKTGYLELKTTTGELSEDQESFGRLCQLHGVPWEVTYGRDEPIAVLERWGACKAMVRQ